MSNHVPSATAIKRNKVHNIDLDRLFRRRSFLVWLLRTNSRSLEHRIDFVMRAAELSAIEDELQARNVTIPRVTLARQDKARVTTTRQRKANPT